MKTNEWTTALFKVCEITRKIGIISLVFCSKLDINNSCLFRSVTI